jgi:hypothetical protein
VSLSEEYQRAPAAKQKPQVGDKRNFYAVDFTRSGISYLTETTCRAVGDFCYIFVEDSQWQRGAVTQTDVVKLKRAFDESTPADPARGIYSLESINLGPPPDEIDLDPKIYILILDIPDNYNGFGSYVAGYFEPINQKKGVMRDPNTGAKLYSNEVEMIYIDSDPLDVGSLISMEILAHEFQHLIHWRHDPNEDIWINEGCSDYAALFLCGYNTDQSLHIAAFQDEPNTSLVNWIGGARSSLANYGAAYLWMLYLHEHYGGVLTISSLIAEPADGINGINTVLSARGYSQSFRDVFSDWKIANYLDDTEFDSGRYGYKNLDLEVVVRHKHSSFPISGITRYMKSWAADYIEITGGNNISDLQVYCSGYNLSDDFDVRVILMKDRKPFAIESLNHGHIPVPKFGHNTDMVILVPSWQPMEAADFAGNFSYSYSAALGNEVGFDVEVLPNSIHRSYVDVIFSLHEDNEADNPRITFTVLGKRVVDEQMMMPIMPSVYVYQMYVPRTWESSEVRWEIYYLGRKVKSGHLGVADYVY